MIQNDRRLTLREISSELGLSYGAVQHIVSDVLRYSKTVQRNHPWRPGSMDTDLIFTKAVEDLTALIFVTSADIVSTPDLFGSVRQSSVLWYPLCYDLRGLNFEQFPRQTLVGVFLISSCDALFVS
ncbi:uncharacterized protein TNCV_4740711 [Trichonephila clavipes]|nr:uncharacterized protein TNCV_4740711 [Trichonephila clavipes]